MEGYLGEISRPRPKVTSGYIFYAASRDPHSDQDRCLQTRRALLSIRGRGFPPTYKSLLGTIPLPKTRKVCGSCLESRGVLLQGVEEGANRLVEAVHLLDHQAVAGLEDLELRPRDAGRQLFLAQERDHDVDLAAHDQRGAGNLM